METTPRKRGAQPGNKNALKHGFYASKFTTVEARDLDKLTTLDLTDEIAMLRVSLRRFFTVIADTNDTEKARLALSTLGQSAFSLANMLKVQKLLQGAGSADVAAALRQALGEEFKELTHIG